MRSGKEEGDWRKESTGESGRVKLNEEREKQRRKKIMERRKREKKEGKVEGVANHEREMTPFHCCFSPLLAGRSVGLCVSKLAQKVKGFQEIEIQRKNTAAGGIEIHHLPHSGPHPKP